jgi:hypothetical protein
MLATLSSHLGRFFAHADELLQECQSFGESVRGSLDTHLGTLNSTVADAMTKAGERAAGQLDEQIERAIGDRLRALRQELDALNGMAAQGATQVRGTAQDGGRAGRLARSATAPEPVRARPGLGLVALLLVAANLMLAALLVVGILRQNGSAAAGAAGPDGAATAAHGIAAANAPEVTRSAPEAPGGTFQAGHAAAPDTLGALCAGLAAKQDPAAARAFVAAAAEAACDQHADAVTASVLQSLAPAAE